MLFEEGGRRERRKDLGKEGEGEIGKREEVKRREEGREGGRK